MRTNTYINTYIDVCIRICLRIYMDIYLVARQGEGGGGRRVRIEEALFAPVGRCHQVVLLTWVWSLGFRVWSLGFGVWGVEFGA